MSDSIIEAEILGECILRGADINRDYVAFRSIEKDIEKTLVVQTSDDEYYFNYRKIRINKERTKIVLK